MMNEEKRMMPSHQAHDYAMEKRLCQLDPALHKRFTDAVFALQFNLSKYQLIFPEYTDHSNLHSLNVISFCNQLIGDQIDRMNADELYILLSACYLHDTGMGIAMKDYREFSDCLDFGNYFENHSRADIPNIIRDFHHEFSGLFIQKYAALFEFPSQEHQWAIQMVSRGHRKTELMDESAYPLALRMPGGNRVCLPYLAALIRLADEIDVAAERNPILLYNIEALTDEKQIMENIRLCGYPGEEKIKYVVEIIPFLIYVTVLFDTAYLLIARFLGPELVSLCAAAVSMMSSLPRPGRAFSSPRTSGNLDGARNTR